MKLRRTHLVKAWLQKPFHGWPVWVWLSSLIATIIAFGEWGSTKDQGQEKAGGDYVPIPIDISSTQGGEGGVPLFNGTAQLNPNNLFGASINGSTNGGGSGLAVRNESGVGGDGLYGSTASDITGANGFAGIHGENTNPGNINGFGVVGTTQSQNGAGVGGFAGAGDAVGVLGYTSSDTSKSAGVRAQYAGNGVGTALEVTGGAIKVTGAGVGTNTSAFIHLITSTNSSGTVYTVIDHPLTNGDPNAILIVTPNMTPAGNLTLAPGVEIVATGVVFATSESMPDFPQWHGKWCIRTRVIGAFANDRGASSESSWYVGHTFNVLVIKT